MFISIFNKLTIKLFFILLCFIPLLACYAEVGSKVEKQDPSNLKEIRGTLLSEAYQDIFTGNYDLKYLGSTGTEKAHFHLYVFLKEFGSNRLTKRLIILSRDLHYLGMYEIPELPNKIEGNMVLFPLEEKWGNKIVFGGNKAPQNIYLDGESYTFFRGDEK